MSENLREAVRWFDRAIEAGGFDPLFVRAEDVELGHVGTQLLDEVLALFPPKTRKDFQRWQANSAESIKGRGQDLNSALGNIAGFSDAGAGLAFEPRGEMTVPVFTPAGAAQ